MIAIILCESVIRLIDTLKFSPSSTRSPDKVKVFERLQIQALGVHPASKAMHDLL